MRGRLVRAARAKAEAARWLMRRREWDLFFVVFDETHPAAHYCWSPSDARMAAGLPAPGDLPRDRPRHRCSGRGGRAGCERARGLRRRGRPEPYQLVPVAGYPEPAGRVRERRGGSAAHRARRAARAGKARSDQGRPRSAAAGPAQGAGAQAADPAARFPGTARRYRRDRLVAHPRLLSADRSRGLHPDQPRGPRAGRRGQTRARSTKSCATGSRPPSRSWSSRRAGDPRSGRCCAPIRRSRGRAALICPIWSWYGRRTPPPARSPRPGSAPWRCPRPTRGRAPTPTRVSCWRAGPQIASGGTLEGGGILDIAPTILARHGVTPPDHMEGKVLPQLAMA